MVDERLPAVPAGFDDAAYEDAGAAVVKTAASLWKQADIIVKVRGATPPPTPACGKRW